MRSFSVLIKIQVIYY